MDVRAVFAPSRGLLPGSSRLEEHMHRWEDSTKTLGFWQGDGFYGLVGGVCLGRAGRIERAATKQPMPPKKQRLRNQSVEAKAGRGIQNNPNIP